MGPGLRIATYSARYPYKWDNLLNANTIWSSLYISATISSWCPMCDVGYKVAPSVQRNKHVANRRGVLRSLVRL